MAGCNMGPKVNFVEKSDRIDVMVDEKLLTSYLYGGTHHEILPDKDPYDVDGGFLAKPILLPVLSPSGHAVTRGYPLIEVEGESTDKAHHAGLSFTYGSNAEVNGNEFWSTTSSPGSVIKHIKTTKMKSKDGRGELDTISHWIDKKGKVLLQEDRKMTFYAGEDEYIIDFSIDLTAQDEKVVFADTKEGLFAIRVAPWLRETPMEGSGIPATGEFLSSNGDRTSKNVWGYRAKWMRLQGTKDGGIIGIAILNHPSTVNYPTYWHARWYGLFAANSIGQHHFWDENRNSPPHLNFTLKPGESGHFGYRVIIYDGDRSSEYFEQQFKDFAKK
jgi:hypothetical protein